MGITEDTDGQAYTSSQVTQEFSFLGEFSLPALRVEEMSCCFPGEGSPLRGVA